MTTVRVGFVGLGTMGSFMAANVARHFPTSVWNRTAVTTPPDGLADVHFAGSLRELAETSDIVVICVTNSPDVEEILFGASGLAPALAKGTLVVDCSTISPVSSQQFATQLGADSISFIDAPVSGGSEGARTGSLSIMVGGSEEDLGRARPVLEAMGSTITHVGPVGSGQWAKAINQVVLAGTYLGVAEGLTLGIKAGLDMDAVVSAISGGAAGSWILNNRSQRMIDNDYPLGFKIALHRKDLAIALRLAEEVGADVAVASLAARYEDELIADGFGNDDNSALARSVRQRSGLA